MCLEPIGGSKGQTTANLLREFHSILKPTCAIGASGANQLTSCFFVPPPFTHTRPRYTTSSDETEPICYRRTRASAARRRAIIAVVVAVVVVDSRRRSCRLVASSSSSSSRLMRRRATMPPTRCVSVAAAAAAAADELRSRN